jgi:hypothetical protein
MHVLLVLCRLPWCTVQDDQTSTQLATQACGFITIVSGTFLLHTTKDLDLTGVNLDHMLDRKEAAAMGSRAESASLSAGSVRERKPAAAALELGALDSVKVDLAADKLGLSNGTGAGKDADSEHIPLIGTGGTQVGASGLSTLGVRKQRGFGGLFG